ncbi:MAG: Kazal-type serine protease inhibitor family protein [Bacteriovoracaceae bacterium]
MKWILLFSLVACSSPKKEEPKPASPYTVKPCFCMKIYEPVCAEGVSYGNSCEAECHGHKTWKEGPCASKKK